MDREAANWLRCDWERETERRMTMLPLFVRKSSNDIQLGKVANEHDFHPLHFFLSSCWILLLFVVGDGGIGSQSPSSSHSELPYQELLSCFNWQFQVKWIENECLLHLLHIGLIILVSTLQQRAPFQLWSLRHLCNSCIYVYAWQNGQKEKTFVTWRHFNFLPSCYEVPLSFLCLCPFCWHGLSIP